MKKLVTLILPVLLTVTMFAPYPRAAKAAPAEVVATIHGRGSAIMTDVVAAGFKGDTTFRLHAKLFSDGTATGHFDCVDLRGDPPGYPGDIFGDITSWSRDPVSGYVTLHVTNGTLIDFSGGPVKKGLQFPVTIQQFGGAGVGHWTLGVKGQSKFNGGPICQELVTKGRIIWKEK